MIPRRYWVAAKYLEYKLQGKEDLPGFKEVLYFLLQPRELDRGMRYIRSVENTEEWLKVWLVEYATPIYYRADMSWTSFCATVDETFNPKNWHYYQIPETPITSTDVIVDCGCAEGLFTFVAAPKAKRVIAFEPLPRFLELLHRTFQDVHNVEIRPQALGSHEGVLHFTDQGIASHASETGEIGVPVTTLDKALDNAQERVTFIKADIEGAEMDMLEGAEHIIREHRPKIAVTVYHDANDVRQIRKYLAGIHADYQFRSTGIVASGNPVMLHAW